MSRLLLLAIVVLLIVYNQQYILDPKNIPIALGLLLLLL